MMKGYCVFWIPSIYHYVKGFYHEHKNHTDDCKCLSGQTS